MDISDRDGIHRNSDRAAMDQAIAVMPKPRNILTACATMNHNHARANEMILNQIKDFKARLADLAADLRGYAPRP